MFKRGVSPVIATVLLIVVTLVAVSLVALFVIPFVKDNLDNSKGCFDVLDDITLNNAGYTCSNASATGGRTGFSVQINNDNIVGFKVILFKEGAANSYSVENGSKMDNIRMLNKDFGNVGDTNTIEVPGKGSVRTYVAKGEYTRVEVNPILITGDICDAKETIEVPRCFDPEIITQLLLH